MTVNWDTDAIIQDVHDATLRGVFEGAELIRATAVNKILNDPASGRVYRRRGVEHQASAPGEAPASDTGRLAQSARTELDTAAVTASAIFSTAYAAALEFGREDGSVEARPYARPSLEEKRAEIQDGITVEILGALT